METGVIHPKLSKLCQEDQLKLLVWKVMLVTLENILSMAYNYDLFLLMHFFCMNLTNQDSERWQVNRSHSSSSGCSNSMAMGFGAMRDMKALIFFTTTSYIQLDRTMLKVNRLLTLNFDCSSLTFPVWLDSSRLGLDELLAPSPIRLEKPRTMRPGVGPGWRSMENGVACVSENKLGRNHFSRV